MASNRLQLSQKRKVTAVIQGLCGILAIACGVALIPLKVEGQYVNYGVRRFSRIAGNVGFGIWGGLIIATTAVMGYIYREKRAMISLYAAFSLVSMIVALILVSVAITGLARFVEFSDYRCNRDFRGYNYDSLSCCINIQYCANYQPHYLRRQTTVQITDPLNDFDSEECQQERDVWRVECRQRVKTAKSANLSVFAILCVTSVVEFIVSITAAVLSFVVVCRGCCKGPAQPVVYLAYPTGGQPGAVPMVVIPGMVPGSATPLMTGVAPNTMTSPYPPPTAAVDLIMAPGQYPYSIPNNTMTAGAMQVEGSPPPEYEAVDDEVKKSLVDN